MEEKQLLAGDTAPDFTYATPFESGLTLSEAVKKAGKTYLVFLRYYGCRICQLDMMAYTKAYDRFREKGAQILLVLQSTPESLKAQTKPEDVPYTIVCDPDQTLYHLYQVRPAGSKEEMMSEKAMAKMQEIQALGLVHGDYEGDELQLPAVFLMDGERKILEAHRAKDVGDMPTVDEMLKKL